MNNREIRVGEAVVVKEDVFVQAGGPGAGDVFIREDGKLRPATDVEITLASDNIVGFRQTRQAAKRASQ